MTLSVRILLKWEISALFQNFANFTIFFSGNLNFPLYPSPEWIGSLCSSPLVLVPCPSPLVLWTSSRRSGRAGAPPAASPPALPAAGADAAGSPGRRPLAAALQESCASRPPSAAGTPPPARPLLPEVRGRRHPALQDLTSPASGRR